MKSFCRSELPSAIRVCSATGPGYSAMALSLLAFCANNKLESQSREGRRPLRCRSGFLPPNFTVVYAGTHNRTLP